ncbi:MAG: Peptidase, partial [Proteobacteria bacterium]|nr:Peptidase [Pseudomonadota bacterium]
YRMNVTLPILSRAVAVGALAAVLAACATKTPVQVSERAAPPPTIERAAGAKTGKDFYIVKKGDYLYSIAREVGQDPKDIAAWNNLDSSTALRIGQSLRIVPPDGLAAGAIAKPIAGPAQVEVKPLAGAAAAPEVARAGTEALKREPKGGKQPYSEQALAMLQKRDELPPPRAAEIPPAAAGKPETKPEGKAADNDSGIDWMWPGDGKLLSQFSEPNSKGVDLGGKAGDPVLAAAGGRVMYVGSGIRGYGNLVIIKHSSGFLSAYAHNRKILVKENQSVAKGQKIAELGDSDADQAKLHFEIRRQGKPVDPLQYLPPR